MNLGECGDASTLPGTAAELFQMAALLTGSGAAAVALVEEALQSVEIDPCQDPETARRLTQREVLSHGVRHLRALEPDSFAAPAVSPGPGAGCVQDDDLDAAGISHAQLAQWLAGEGRQDLREWLAALPASHRVIFVERAVLGENNGEAALALGGWPAEAVGQVYRQVLCSLANALAHAPVPSVHAGAPSAGLPLA